MVMLTEFLPPWVFATAVILAFGGLFVTQMSAHPLVRLNRLPLQLAFAVTIASGMWAHGASVQSARYKERERVLVEQVKAAHAAAVAATGHIQYVTVEKIVYVKEKSNANKRTFVTNHAAEVDRDCSLSSGAVGVLHASSQNEVATSTASPPEGAASAEAPPASAVLTTVIENYGTCNEYREVIKGWQDWYYTQKKIYESNGEK